MLAQRVGHVNFQGTTWNARAERQKPHGCAAYLFGASAADSSLPRSLSSYFMLEVIVLSHTRLRTLQNLEANSF